MTTLPRTLKGLPLLAGAILLLASCGGGDGDDSSSPLEEQIDLAETSPLLTVTFPAGLAPQAVAVADFNGDGAADLLLGAPLSDGPDGSRDAAGEAYIVFGPLAGEVDLSEREPDVRILGSVEGDNLGAGVAVGDLNDDGVADAIVGAPFSNGLDNIRTDMGEIYAVFGGNDLPAVIDTALAEQDFGFLPAEGFAHLGASLAVADVNGDGVDDLIAGAPYAGREPGTPPGGPRTTVGEVYVVYGSSELRRQLSAADEEEDVRIEGGAELDQFGVSVAAADVNDDGTADIIVGAPGYDGPGGAESGAVFVFHGDDDLPRDIAYTDADLSITGAAPGDAFGSLVLGADATGDGRAEVIAAAPSAAGPDGRSAAGLVAVVDAREADDGTVDLTSAEGFHQIFIPATGELGPTSLTADASGTDQLIALGSANHAAPERDGAGAVFVLGARVDSDIDLAEQGDGFTKVLGAAGGDGLGASLALGDIDGDGVAELLALAPGGSESPARLYAIRLTYPSSETPQTT